jgi:hypothetical protein
LLGTETAPAGTTTAADQGGTDVPRHKLVQSGREERQYRLQLWASRLRGDMKATFETYGFPSTRYREIVLGRTVERWTYIEAGKQFVFEDGKLVKTVALTPSAPWADKMHRLFLK